MKSGLTMENYAADHKQISKPNESNFKALLLIYSACLHESNTSKSQHFLTPSVLIPI